VPLNNRSIEPSSYCFIHFTHLMTISMPREDDDKGKAHKRVRVEDETRRKVKEEFELLMIFSLLSIQSERGCLSIPLILPSSSRLFLSREIRYDNKAFEH
jgi:hypothetical protein